MKISFLAVLVFSFFAVSSFAFDKVVYGEDNRLEVSEAPALLADLARSTAGMFTKDKLVKNGSFYSFNSRRTLQKDYKLCSSERYLTQPTFADCSGFLVGPDLLVTAGHCIQMKRDCEGYSWIFDYKVNKDGPAVSFPESNVYNCKEIISQKFEESTKNDYALIRLDRVVVDRTPLTVRMTGKVSETSELVVIGHPSGLPTKVTMDGSLRKNLNPVYFEANLDTFAGNSGSVVVDAQTGTVEGILVRGEEDYVKSGSCYVANVCEEGKCRGEDVTRITNLAPILKPLLSK